MKREYVALGCLKRTERSTLSLMLTSGLGVEDCPNNNFEICSFTVSETWVKMHLDPSSIRMAFSDQTSESSSVSYGIDQRFKYFLAQTLCPL